MPNEMLFIIISLRSKGLVFNVTKKKKNIFYVSKFLPKKIRKIIKNVTIIVIRYNRNLESNNTFIMSRPCSKCVETMMWFGINKIIYSDNNSNLISKKSKNIQSHNSRLTNARINGTVYNIAFKY